MDNYNKVVNVDITVKVNESLSDNCIEYSTSEKISNIKVPEANWIRFLSDLAQYIEYDLNTADDLDFITPAIIDSIYEAILTSQNFMNSQDIIFSINLPDNNVATFIIPYMIKFTSICTPNRYKILYYGNYMIIKGDVNPLKDFSVVRDITDFNNFRKYKEASSKEEF